MWKLFALALGLFVFANRPKFDPKKDIPLTPEEFELLRKYEEELAGKDVMEEIEWKDATEEEKESYRTEGRWTGRDSAEVF